MGIYDRDYIRRPPGGPGFGHTPGAGAMRRMRMWSVNTWIIVICVGVFVIDGFLPKTWARMQTVPINPAALAQADPSLLVLGPEATITATDRGVPVRIFRTVLLQLPDGTTEPVARQYFQRMRLIEKYMHFSTARALVYTSPTYGLVGFEFWRFIGFQFLHANLGHLFFNMLALYFFGPMVERYLGSKRYLAFYLLSGIFGALMYMTLNLGGYVVSLFSNEAVSIPGLLFNSPTTPLIGASAGVFGVLMAGAYLAPNAIVLLFFILPMRLRTLAYALVAVSLLTILTSGANAGGEAGHLGGALAGFYFIRHPKHLHGFFDIIGRVDPTSHHYRGRRGGRGTRRPGRTEIDRILDKITAKGLQSLTEKEKRALAESSERGR